MFSHQNLLGIQHTNCARHIHLHNYHRSMGQFRGEGLFTMKQSGFGPEQHPAVKFHGKAEDEFLMFTTTETAFVTEHIKRSPTA